MEKDFWKGLMRLSMFNLFRPKKEVNLYLTIKHNLRKRKILTNKIKRNTNLTSSWNRCNGFTIKIWLNSSIRYMCSRRCWGISSRVKLNSSNLLISKVLVQVKTLGQIPSSIHNRIWLSNLKINLFPLVSDLSCRQSRHNQSMGSNSLIMFNQMSTKIKTRASNTRAAMRSKSKMRRSSK